MLSFRKITLKDQAEVKRYTAKTPSLLCEHCFVDLFIWWDHYDTEICFTEDFLFIRCVSFPERKPMYVAPIGQGDLREAIKLLREDAAARSIPFQLVSIPEAQLGQYEQAIGDEFHFAWSEDSADYIYLGEKLCTLAGKKLQSKRNMINRFQAAFDGRWRYEDITADNTAKAYDYHIEWCRQHGCAKNDSFIGETCAVKLALDHFAELDLRGGMLLVDDKVIAYTLGCKVHDTLAVVQIEKANPEIDGAYQMINQQFVRTNFADIRYINREEDLGLDGLRKAKQSYKPEMLGKKYYTIARVE